MDLKGLARARVRRVHDEKVEQGMEAARADGLLIDCSAAQVIGSGGHQVQHTHELHVDVRSSSCRHTIRSSLARGDWREAGGMNGLMNKRGKMKESDAKSKEEKKMATGTSPNGTRLAPVLEDSVR